MPTQTRLLLLALLLSSGSVVAQTKPCPTTCSIDGTYTAGPTTFLLNTFNPTTEQSTNVQLTCPDAILFKWSPLAPATVAVNGANATITLQPGQSTTQTITALGAEGCVLGSRRVVFSRSKEEAAAPVADSTTIVPPLRRRPAQLLLVPNPTAGIISFYSNNAETVQISVYNILGQRVLNRPVAIASTSEPIDLTDFPAGFYRLQVIDEGGFLQDFKLLLQYH